MQDAGYWVMMAGKDDLTKHHGVDITGDYRQTELGFNDQRRCLGKQNNIGNYPIPKDPYAVYLQTHYHIDSNGKNRSEWDIMYDFMKHSCENSVCPQPLPIHEESYEDNWITQQSLKMMDDIPDKMPWFLQVNWAGPHNPFLILDSMMETVNDRTFPYPMHSKLDDDTMAMTRRNYVAEIENLDKQMALILDRVRSMGQYENTVICITSDHGEMLGDYNEFSKHKPWVSSTNVPLVCMGPDIERGQIIESYVSNMDLAGTFLDYTGSQMEEEMSTISLRPFMNGAWNYEVNLYREYVSTGLDESSSSGINWRAVIQDINETVTWKFICCKWHCPGRSFKPKNGLVQLLFNVKEDLYEENDLFALHHDVADEMRTLLPSEFCKESSAASEFTYLLIAIMVIAMLLTLCIGALCKIRKQRHCWWTLLNPRKENKSTPTRDSRIIIMDNGCDETTALIQ